MQLKTDVLGVAPESAGEGEASARSFKPPAAKVTSAVDALHHALAERGTDSLVQLGKKFHVLDNDGSNGLCYEEVCVHECWFVFLRLNTTVNPHVRSMCCCTLSVFVVTTVA